MHVHEGQCVERRWFVFALGATCTLGLLVAAALWRALDAFRFGGDGLLTVSAFAAVALLAAGAAAHGVLSMRRWRRAMFVAILERQRAEATLRRAEEYQRLFRQASDPILILDPAADLVLDVNDRACEVYDIPRETFLGRSLASITRDTRNLEGRFRTLLRDGVSQEFETVHFRSNGTPIHFQVNAALIDFQDRPAVISIHRDITERKALEEQLAHQAFHDSLTGLLNRAVFRDRVEHAVARGIRHPQPLIVMFLDLDNFKSINDSLGHAAGDQVLVMFAKRLHESLRLTDTVARLGGDEFAILLEDARHPEDSVPVAERITRALRLPFLLDGKEISVSASIGIAATNGGGSADELLRNADVAMYIAKNRGGGCYEVYDPAMHAVVTDRLDLEADLRRAIERQELILHYQPIVTLAEGRITGLEALVRWIHPERGLLAPGAFIPIAEETGLIVPLGRWVLEEACRQARRWQQQHALHATLTVTVNMSARQLHHPELLETVSAALAASGLPAGSLILELTESVLMRDAEAILDKFGELRKLGVRLALDDFGTGYSSLGHLQRFPIDILKIEQQFIEGVENGASEAAVARAIVALGESLGLQTIAEGVRSSAQCDALQAIGCRYGQGFHFARPLDRSTVDLVLSHGGTTSLLGFTLQQSQTAAA